MKKYIQPQIEIISLYMEDVILSGSPSDKPYDLNDNITDNSNWSNKKEGPFGQSSSIWDNNME